MARGAAGGSISLDPRRFFVAQSPVQPNCYGCDARVQRPAQDFGDRQDLNGSSVLPSCSQKTIRHKIVRLRPISHHIWGHMAFAKNCGSEQLSVALRPNGHLTLGLIGMGVIFASLGLGEAVYRVVFLDFDGATDRLPIEMLFGLAFAWMTTKLARRIYQKSNGDVRENQLDSGSQLQDSSRGRNNHPRAISEQSASDPCDS